MLVIYKRFLKDLQTFQNLKYDGINGWITVGMEYEESAAPSSNEGIGIDLGIKDLAACSDEHKYLNINKTQKVKKLEKQKRRLQRSISRRYEKNKKGECYCKTRNIIKSEKKLLELNYRLANKRQNYLHQTTSSIIKREPRFISLEDLNVSGMMKNKHLSKVVQRQGFYEFRRQIEYECGNVIDRDYQGALNLKKYGEMFLKQQSVA